MTENLQEQTNLGRGDIRQDEAAVCQGPLLQAPEGGRHGGHHQTGHEDLSIFALNLQVVSPGSRDTGQDGIFVSLEACIFGHCTLKIQELSNVRCGK